MSNIIEDIKLKGFIEGYKQIKNNVSIVKSIDKDFFFELVDYLLEEREQSKVRIKELEEALLKVKDKNIKLFINSKNSIPVQKVKDKIEELKKEYEDSKDENGESEYYYPDYAIRKLEELLNDK